MKISNDFLIGVSHQAFCSFYSDVQRYRDRLVQQYPELNNDQHTLTGMIVAEKNGIITESYFVGGTFESEFGGIKIPANFIMIQSKADINNKSGIWDLKLTPIYIPPNVVIKTIEYQPHVMDIEWFLKNN